MTSFDDSLDLTSLDDFDAPALPPPAGFRPLGTCQNGKVVVFSALQKTVVTLSASDLSETPLKLRLGATYYDELATYLQAAQMNQGKRPVRNPNSLVANHIIQACQSIGPYTHSATRKTGIWPSDDGQLIINSDRLWRSDGVELEHGVHGRYVYPISEPIGFTLDTPCASPAEVQRILTALSAYQWVTPLAAELAIGWFGVAIAAGALRRRPHLMITGPIGCGKSTLLETMSNLLGNNITSMTGAPTLMGLHQLLHDRPTNAIAIDEFEADPSRKHCQDTFEAARASYSAQESDKGLVRGGANGEVRVYRLTSPFIAAAVSPGRMEPADKARWVVLETQHRTSTGSPLAQQEAREIGPRMARLFVSRWPLFTPSLDAIRHAIQAAGADARLADTYGYLLACYWVLTHAQSMKSSEADRLAANLDIHKTMRNHATQDEQECLTALLTKVISVNSTTTGGGYRKLDIASSLRCITHQQPDDRAIRQRLSQLGLRPTCVGGRWYLMVANSPNHSELKKLFSGTKWAGGGWGRILCRLPHGTESTQRLGPGLPACKVTIFELPSELQPTAAVSAICE